MITRERLERTEYGRGLLEFFSRMMLYKVTDWGSNNSGDPTSRGSREQVVTLADADVVTSLCADGRHNLVLDIDHPAWLMPSTTPGHYHLYVKVPGGIGKAEYANLLDALMLARVIDPGYVGASLARGYTSVRLPWIRKGAVT